MAAAVAFASAAISVGFTAHYAAMRARFGEHAVLGCAGENIIVETEGRITLDDVSSGFVIQTASGAQVELSGGRVAEPCRPFTGNGSPPCVPRG